MTAKTHNPAYVADYDGYDALGSKRLSDRVSLLVIGGTSALLWSIIIVVVTALVRL